MTTQRFETLALPETSTANPDHLLGLHDDVLNHRLPGFVVKDTSLDEVADIVLPTNAVRPSNGFGLNHDEQHEVNTYANGVERDLGYHVHALPDYRAPTILLHHYSHKGQLEHTVGTFTERFADSRQYTMTPEERLNLTYAASRHAKKTLRYGRVNPSIFEADKIYRANIGPRDLVVNRLVGRSPVVHNYRTIPGSGARGMTLRGYTAIEPEA